MIRYFTQWGDVMEKVLIFSIPFYGLDENVYEVYYKGGYYTVERPENIFAKTQFSGTLEDCKKFLQNRVLKEFGFPVNFSVLMGRV